MTRLLDPPKTAAKTPTSVRTWFVWCIILVQSAALFSFYSGNAVRSPAGEQTDRKMIVSDNEPLQPQDTSCNVSTVADSWQARIPSIVSHKVPMATPPSDQTPFVFFHVRKAGGTLWRKMLHTAAKKLGLSKWIVCHDNVNCRTYNVPVTGGRTALYGGHLYYADVANHLGFEGDLRKGQAWKKERKPNMNCLVSIRPTVSRVVSCWNYRMGQIWSTKKVHYPPANNLTAAQWADYLPNTFSMEKEGCNNELLRVFGDIAHEPRVNSFYTDPDAADAQKCAVARTEVDLMMDRLSQCIVTINGRFEENLEVIQHYAPWLAPFFAENGDKPMNAAKTPKQNAGLQPGAAEEILSQNRVDEYVYQFGHAVFQEQLRVARLAASGSSSLPVTTTKTEPQFCDYCPSGVAQFSCGDRVHYLVNQHGLSEADAKSTVISQAASTAEMCQVVK